MKKLFMFAAALALGFGVSGCDKGPGGDVIGPNGGVASGMSLSISLPAGAGATRQTNGAVDGVGTENDVKMVYAFLFNSNGTQPDFGGFNKVAFTEDVTFEEDDTVPGQWNMIGEAFPATVGEGMKLYVAVNIPSDIASDLEVASNTNPGTLTETLLLAKFDDVADLQQGATTGFTMFSNGKTVNVDRQASLNNFSDGVYRAVAKVTATIPNAGAFPAVNTWSAAPAAPFEFPYAAAPTTPFTVTYDRAHWRVFQNTFLSYVVQHYTLPNSTKRPVTLHDANYGTPTSTVLNSYVKSWPNNANAYKVLAGTTAVPNDFTGTGPGQGLTVGGSDMTAQNAQYIGENSNEQAARENQATYLYLSTAVTVKGTADWNDTNKQIEWTATSASGYGTGTTDIWVIKDNMGNVYLTDTEAKANNIATGLFNYGKSEPMMNIRILTDEEYAEFINPADPANPQITDAPGTEMTEKMYRDTYPQFFVKIYKYADGYAHFQHFLGRVNTGEYDVLRNQFIHVAVSGMKNGGTGATVGEYKFPGNPGQREDWFYDEVWGLPYETVSATDPTPKYDADTGELIMWESTDPDVEPGNPKIGINPIDVTGPFPIEPGSVIDPEASAMNVNVQILPWNYKVEGKELGR